MVPGRQMLIFVSDLHLTGELKGPAVSRAATFDRFWTRIDVARGERPARLCFVGDLFDIIRSRSWLDTELRPYHEPSPEVLAHVETIVAAIIERESEFLGLVRKAVEAGLLEIDYLLGNHDRLVSHSPKARRMIWKALTGEDRDVEFPSQIIYPEHRVLARHGHTADFVNYNADGSAAIGDAIAPELIMRFPRDVRKRLDAALPELDDLDDVRPIFAVPAWVRHYAVARKGVMGPVNDVWADNVENFLQIPFANEWMKDHRKEGGKKLRLLLQLSTGKILKKTKDHRLAQLYRFFQTFFDGRFARSSADILLEPEHAGLRFVVSGHSHYPSMTPLGDIDGEPTCYFNTGTWRTVHQMGRLTGGRPGFLAYEAMAYLVFFASDDPMGRDYEWWTGAMVAA